MKKGLKIVGIILVIIIILIFIHTMRNYTIIKKLQENFNEYKSSNNFNILSEAKESDNTTVTMDYYQKDNKKVIFIERETNGEKIKLSMYNNGERVDMFTDGNNEKTCNLGVDTDSIQVKLVNYLETDNNWQTFLGCILAKISKETYNQKECYVIKNFTTPGFLYSSDKDEVYLEKDTGLYVKSIMGGIETKREYNFNNVNDSIFVEPDIGQYKIVESK